MNVAFTYSPSAKTSIIVDNSIYGVGARDLVDVVLYVDDAPVATFDPLTNTVAVTHQSDGVVALEVKSLSKLDGSVIDTFPVHYILVNDYAKGFLKAWLIKLMTDGCCKLPYQYVEIKKRIRATESYFYAKALPKVTDTLKDIAHAIYHLSPNQSTTAHTRFNRGQS